MSLDLTPVHRNLHTKVTFLGLEFEDLILVLALAALMNLLAHFVSGNAHVFGMWWMWKHVSMARIAAYEALAERFPQGLAELAPLKEELSGEVQEVLAQ